PRPLGRLAIHFRCEMERRRPQHATRSKQAMLTTPFTLKAPYTEKTATIAVVGLGYVGMPLALAASAAGFRVIGCDVDPAKVQMINAGKSYFKHIPSAKIATAVGGKRLHATADFSDLAHANAIVVCVPTPLTAHREPDLTYVVGTAQAIAPHLQK